MHLKLQRALESLLLNVEVLGEEIHRLAMSEQFEPLSHNLQLIERIRGACTGSLQTLRTVERALHKARDEVLKNAPEVLPFK